MNPIGPAPVLVTGLPRSGTTWLARELTRAPRVALAGREPMNPRGGQFGLGGSLHAWTRLTDGMSVQQRRTLRRTYRGWEPRTYSRYGLRQWAAPLPWVRVVIKDPFALLSLGAITDTTGATAVVLFRHPGAMLTSFRRMGWSPAITELAALDLPGQPGEQPPEQTDDVAAMAWFWSRCYRTVAHDVRRLAGVVLVDHTELVRGGEPALRSLMSRCGIDGSRLRPAPRSAVERPRGTSRPELHNFRRSAAQVADGWRSQLPADDVRRLEALVAAEWEALRELRARLDDAREVGVWTR